MPIAHKANIGKAKVLMSKSLGVLRFCAASRVL